MQKAKLILTKLNQKSKSDKLFKFRRLYRNLYNLDFYLNAYGKIHKSEGNMTKGIDGKTIDGFNIIMIEDIIQKLRYERYNPKPVRRTYILKKDGKRKRPLGISTFEDKLIEEVLRQILEVIYEPLFSSYSHGFRPNRSCQTALYQIKKIGLGCSWVIEGDIKGFFDNIDHEILINILKQKIDDERFLNLIRKFLKAGIMEEGKIRDSITGAPQGGIISPILANIYLNELDKYLEIKMRENWIGKERRINLEYKRMMSKRHRRLKSGKYKEAKEILKKLQKLPSMDPLDQNFKRIKYVRYADDFVVMVYGSKALAEEVRVGIAKHLKNNLKLELNMEKTVITNILKKKVQFLGYEFCKGKEDTKMSISSNGIKRRSINGIIQLLVPAKVINEKVKPFIKDGKPTHRKDRINKNILLIISQYNAEIRGLYNFYGLANNVGKRIGKFRYYHYYSLVKTIANKHKLSVKKTIDKYGIKVKRKLGTGTVNIIGVKYKIKSGEKIITYFNESLKRTDYPLLYDPQLESSIKNYKNELVKRLLNNKCELCGRYCESDSINVHHIRKLKVLKEKYAENKKEKITTPNWIKLMIKMNRKTLVVCKKCHYKIHK